MAPIWRLLAAVLVGAALCAAGPAPLVEEFGEGWQGRWRHSTDDKYIGRFEVEDVFDDPALKVPAKAQHYGAAETLEEPLDPAKGLVVQYEAKWSEGHTCSGGYLKLFTHSAAFDANGLVENTPYTVMFGPDKCGQTNKVHLIVRHNNPINGTADEKHLMSPPRTPGNSLTHLYTAILKPDNTFAVLIDGKEEASGSLFDKFDPPFNPPKEIDDPEDKKPEDWVDNAKMPDPDAKKPDDWVEEAMIVDENATKPEGWLDDEPDVIDDPDAEEPEDWDTEEDGEWEPPKIPNPLCKSAPGCGEWSKPMIKNPEYKGEWRAPKIDNPDYKGPWSPRKIPNPHFYEDAEPLKNIGKIGAVGVEIWTMDSGIYFDNIIVAQDEELVTTYKEKWSQRHVAEEAEQEARRKKDTSRKEGAAGFLQDLADRPELEAIRPYLLPIVDVAENNTLIFYGVGLFALFFTLFGVISCCRRSSKSYVFGVVTERIEADGVVSTRDRHH
eukprot:evm.model.scf_125.9 EVM.evm.TU.scf_125.9   scf_125:127517-133743(+)